MLFFVFSFVFSIIKKGGEREKRYFLVYENLTEFNNVKILEQKISNFCN